MPAQDLSTQFDTDWQKAQARYQAGVNNRLTEADAAQLYLAPIQAKWKIIQASPGTFQRAGNMAKINSNFEDAQASAQKDAFDRSSGGATDLSLLVQKWMTQVASDKASGKASAYEKRIELSDIRSSIRNANRARTKSGDIVRSGLQGITDPDKLAARKQMLEDNTANVSGLDAQIADLTAQEKTLLSGSTVENPPAQPGAATMPDQPTAAAPAMPAGNVFGSLGGQSNGNSFEPAQAAANAAWNARFGQNATPQVDPASEQAAQGPPAEAAPQMPNPHAGTFYIGGDGKPPLTNFVGSNDELKAWLNAAPETQAQANTAWAARSAPRMNPPADAAPGGTAANIPPTAIKFLQQNPGAWKDFETKYGQGSSANYLP